MTAKKRPGIKATKNRPPMDAATFKASLVRASPPPDVDQALAAMWHAAKGDWNRAHDLAQEQDDQSGAWVHAYLHRVEGDLPNADWWYRQAGRRRPKASTDDEWLAIVETLLEAARD